MTKTKGKVTNDTEEGNKVQQRLGMLLIVFGALISLTIAGAIIGIPMIIVGMLLTDKAGATGENPFECPNCGEKLGFQTKTCPECGEEDLSARKMLNN